MLAHIAAKAFDEGEFLFPQRKLAGMIEAFMKQLPGMDEAALDGEVILRSISARHGIFVEQAKDVYSFAHISFQEYFTARYIVSNVRQGTLERLINKVTEERWHEVFLLTVSLLDDADEFFSLYLDNLNEMCKTSTLIMQLLTWAGDKKDVALKSMELTYTQVSLIALYLFRASASRRDDLAITLDLTLKLDLTLALDFTLYFTLNGIHAFPSLKVANLNLDLAHDLSPNQDIFDEIGDISDKFNEATLALFKAISSTLACACDFSSRLGLVEFNKVLTGLSLPDPNESEVQWEATANTFSDIINRFHDLSGMENLNHGPSKEDQDTIRKMVWSNKEIDLYVAYMKATQLLVDCLPLAMVSDRAAIEEQLLQPAE